MLRVLAGSEPFLQIRMCPYPVSMSQNGRVGLQELRLLVAQLRHVLR